MRLIDADELMALLRVRKNSGIGTEIEEIPTVKAIPIEFLRKWFDTNYNAFTDLVMAWNIEEAKIKLYEYPNKIYSHEEVSKQLPEIEEAIPIEWIKKWVKKCNWHYTDLPRIIETMLEDWEKENEENI